MKRQKEQQLDKLFGAYLAEGKAPDRRVTEKAREALLNSAAEKEPVQEAEPLAAGNAGKAGSFGHMTRRRKRETVILAAVFGCAVLLVLWLFLAQAFTSQKIVLNWSQLNKVTNTASYEKKDFLPFVSEDSVNRYDEFGLNEESPYYDEYEGDIVLYYVQYESYGVEVDLLIESDGFQLEDLEDYADGSDDYETDELILYIDVNREKSQTYIYFEYDIYQYYMVIYTAEEPLLYDILEEVVKSF